MQNAIVEINSTLVLKLEKHKTVIASKILLSIYSIKMKFIVETKPASLVTAKYCYVLLCIVLPVFPYRAMFLCT